MGVSIGGRQICRSAHTTNKGLAKKLLTRWENEVFEGRFQLIKTNAPTFEEWANQFLLTITPDLFEEYKDERLAEGVGPATVNRDLAVARRLLKLAERRRFIVRSPFAEVEFLEERSMRRKPHIVTFEEEERILAVADPHIRTLTVLLLQTGMRPNREALSLRWDDIDFVTDAILIRESKTSAGIRSIPLSNSCKAELLAWRNRFGPEFSPFVFPNPQNPVRHLTQIRRSWAKALEIAGIPHFWLYNLRHTFASRLSAAGVADLFVAQMIGHSTPSIVQTYAKAIDEHKRAAIRKLEALRPESQPIVLPSGTARRPN